MGMPRRAFAAIPARSFLALGMAGLSLGLHAGCGSDGGAGAQGSAGPSAVSPPGWTLVWSDEFDGPPGALVDATKWVAEVGGHGWGNQELEYYTDRPRNAHLSGDGALVIEALRETFTGNDGITREYTSARLKTQRRFEQAYGRFEARLQIPRGQGLWPAFWLLGSHIDASGWPRCGEIDVMENVGREPATVHGTMHGPGYSGAGGIGAAFSLAADQRFADSYHLFAIEWDREPPALRWYVDDTLYEVRTPADLPAGARWVYDHPFFLLLNVAVGGSWPGRPDATTVFPQAMKADFVRVYARISGS
jgi:beta-glucanase (GH16 family)